MEKPVKGEKAEQAPAEQIEKMQKAEGAQAEKGQKKTRKDKSGKMDKEHKGKGHAYGHHKDGQSGKEFGQERAADAKDKEKIEQQKTLKKAKKEKSFERR